LGGGKGQRKKAYRPSSSVTTRCAAKSVLLATSTMHTASLAYLTIIPLEEEEEEEEEDKEGKGVLLNLAHPHDGALGEGSPVRDVVDHYDGVRTAVVGRRDGPEPFGSRRVPYLQLTT
jgi:hypothetical protein